MFFINKIKHINFGKEAAGLPMDIDELRYLKKYGFCDKAIGELWGCGENDIYALRKKNGVCPVYKMIDTCASEFDSYIPYFYSTWADEKRERCFRQKKDNSFGLRAYPHRSGIEFDYSTVHAVMTIKNHGYEAIIINNNPETVSTDYTCSDKLYFEPLTVEDVMNIIDLEKPMGVIASLGGQTAINLARPLMERGVKIIGTDCEAIDRAENRESFEKGAANAGYPPAHGRRRDQHRRPALPWRRG